MVGFIAIARYVFGAVGLGMGYYYFTSGDASKGAAIACLGAVGLVGLVSFISHVIFHKQDAKRIGLATENPAFQYEVGFANLAFGIVSFISYYANWGVMVNAILILTFALYLFQAGILHTIVSFSGGKHDIKHFLRGGLLTFLYSGFMIYFAIIAINSVKP